MAVVDANRAAPIQAEVDPSAWAELARQIATPIPFDHPGWHDAWWRHFGAGRTRLDLTVFAHGELAAVVPLLRDGDTLSLAGDPEICDTTSLPICASATAELLTRTFAAIDVLPWSTLHLWGLVDGCAALVVAMAWAGSRGYRAEIDFEAVCPRVALPTTWDAYLERRSKKDRHELKRKLRRFSEVGTVTRQTLTAPDAVTLGLDTFFRLHRISRRDKAEFMSAQMEAFFRDACAALAADGLVRLDLTRVDGIDAAALLSFVSGDEALLYNSGYDPAFASVSVGIVSKALALQSAIEDGMAVFDLLRGAEPYKYALGGEDRILRQMWIRRDG